jgi:hypothetical protein
MRTISKIVQQYIKQSLQKQVKLDELVQQRWEDVAHIFCERDMMYRKAELNVPAIVKLQTAKVAAAPPSTTVGELMQTLDIIPGQL